MHAAVGLSTSMHPCNFWNFEMALLLSRRSSKRAKKLVWKKNVAFWQTNQMLLRPITMWFLHCWR